MKPVADVHEFLAKIAPKSITQSSGKDSLLADLEGWDSLKYVRLVLQLEERLDRQLAEDEIEKLRSLADVERLLSAGV